MSVAVRVWSLTEALSLMCAPCRQAWDLAVDICLSQLPTIIEEGTAFRVSVWRTKVDAPVQGSVLRRHQKLRLQTAASPPLLHLFRAGHLLHGSSGGALPSSDLSSCPPSIHFGGVIGPLRATKAAQLTPRFSPFTSLRLSCCLAFKEN